MRPVEEEPRRECEGDGRIIEHQGGGPGLPTEYGPCPGCPQCQPSASVVLGELRERIELEASEYKAVGEGAPGDFTNNERAKAWGAHEHCHKLLNALAQELRALPSQPPASTEGSK